jgi:hypothetical protein
MGDVLTVSDNQDIDLKILAFSTPEFGPVEHVELVTCFRHYRKPNKTNIQQGEIATIQLDGLGGYCRLFAQTKGPDGQLFCCFTNPIWVRITDEQEHRLMARYD